ncbi:MAG: acyltransferase family protein [Planctomycetaceae bacterium]|nr:acyltransferase family protein [Planctomycetaceae bacterium]
MRRPFVDNARALGIILVVLGHAWLDSAAVTIIYAFHMPLFFFISGALWKPSVWQDGWRAFVTKQVRTLLVPYLCFGLISWLIMLAARAALDQSTDARPSLVASLTPLAYGAGRSLREINGTLWFFTALMMTNLYYFVLGRVPSRVLQIAIALAVAILALTFRQQHTDVLPWNVDVAAVALVFFVLGQSLLGNQQEQHWRPRGLLAALAGIFAAACVAMALNNPDRVDLRSLTVGSTPLFFGGAIAGVLATILLAMIVPASRIAAEISKASIVIFPMHVICLLAFQVLEKRFWGVPETFAEQWPRGIAYAVASLLVCLPLYWFLKRFLPFCIGGR